MVHYIVGVLALTWCIRMSLFWHWHGVFECRCFGTDMVY